MGACAPSYAGPQLARAEGAPDELTPEDVDAFGLHGCAYMRGVSESLEWARPLAGSLPGWLTPLPAHPLADSLLGRLTPWLAYSLAGSHLG